MNLNPFIIISVNFLFIFFLFFLIFACLLLTSLLPYGWSICYLSALTHVHVQHLCNKTVRNFYFYTLFVHNLCFSVDKHLRHLFFNYYITTLSKYYCTPLGIIFTLHLPHPLPLYFIVIPSTTTSRHIHPHILYMLMSNKALSIL